MIVLPALAQSGQVQGGSSVGSILLWSVLLMVLVFAGAFAINALRKWMLGDSATDAGEGLSLHSLREMHASGEMSDAEFESAKAALLGLPAPDAEVLQAEPGFDLAGDPLPGDSEPDTEESGTR